MEGYRRASRVFRVWRFSATHNQLILRSEPAMIDKSTTRAEVYFGNVQLMFLRPIHQGVHIRKMSEEQRRQAIERFVIPENVDGSFYLIDVDGGDFIVSSTPSWREADVGFDEPSLFDFDRPWPPGPEVTWGTIE